MNTFDILSQETSILGNWFLQASAGTGKTFTIEHLFVRLILESDLPLDQILVVTFTRAAARELKMRIRLNLEKVLQEPQAFPYLKNCVSKDKIQEALLAFDQAQIFTIHGFCQKMLQEYAFEAGIGLKTEPWTLEEERREALSFFRKAMAKYSHSQRNILLKKFRNDIGSLIKNLLKETLSLKILESFEVSLQKVNGLFQTMPYFPLAHIFEQEVIHYKKMTDPQFLLQARFLDEYLLKKSCSLEELDQLLLQKPYFLEGLEESNLKVKSIGHSLDQNLSYLRKHLLPIIQEISDPALILKDLASYWKKEKQQLSLMKDKISPDEILEKMEESLACPSFLKQVRKKYQAVIVDEFQDTDQIQWNIFDQLFLSVNMKAIYLVGDPKQSIYAFRQADIYTFLGASKKFPFHAHLGTNYRSEPGLLHMLNKLFCPTPWIDLPAWGETLPVLPVKAGKQGEGELHFFVAEGKLGREKRWPSSELEREYFFPFIVQEIQKVSGTCSIAILVKDRFQALRIHTFLQKWNCVSSIQRGASLGESLALSALQELTSALVKQDLSLIKKTLLGPLIGWTEADLTEDNIFFAREQFSKLGSLFKERGFGAFWGEFLDTKWPLSTILERLVSLPDLNLYHDLQEIVQKAIMEKDSERICSFLEELKTSEVTDRILGEPTGIQIMTTHASKGLEFDVVFALGLVSRTMARDSSEGELKELDAEKMRQLYVALTRAKQKLYAPLAIDLDQKPVALGEASPMELFWDRVKPILDEYPHTLLNQTSFSLSSYHSSKTTILHPPLPCPSLPPAEFILSFSSLAKPSSHTPISFSPTALPSGAETGIILHRIFEKVLPAQERLESIITEEVAGTLLEPWIKEITALVEKTLTLPLTTFSLKDIALAKMQPEMEFLFSTKTGLMKGYIDLWFEKDGKYFIVDWKTNLLEAYDLPHLEQAMNEGDYFLQAAIYTSALKKYIAMFDPRPFNEWFGGVCYLFVRGPACFHFYPEESRLLNL